jgi:hypothetical protein
MSSLVEPQFWLIVDRDSMSRLSNAFDIIVRMKNDGR